MATVEFDGEKGDGWDQTAAALDVQRHSLARDIMGRVSRMVDPWIDEAQSEVEDMPIKGVGHQHGLRVEVANAVAKYVEGPAEAFTVTVDPQNPDPAVPSEIIIPLGLDRTKGWRHPVFAGGMRYGMTKLQKRKLTASRTWVQQVPLTHDWFTSAFSDAREPEISLEIQAAMDEAVREIADS